MQNIHRAQHDGKAITVNLARNTGIWIKVESGVELRLETSTDGSVSIYNSNGAPFYVENPIPAKVILSEKA